MLWGKKRKAISMWCIGEKEGEHKEQQVEKKGGEWYSSKSKTNRKTMRSTPAKRGRKRNEDAAGCRMDAKGERTKYERNETGTRRVARK